MMYEHEQRALGSACAQEASNRQAEAVTNADLTAATILLQRAAKFAGRTVWRPARPRLRTALKGTDHATGT